MNRKFTKILTKEEANTRNAYLQGFSEFFGYEIKQEELLKEGDYDYTEEAKTTNEMLDYVGKLEDLEQKLGIDLITLTNSIGNRVYFVQSKDIRVLICTNIILHKDNTWELVCGDEADVLKYTIVPNKFYISNKFYKKNWFLTKEEAKKKLEEVK